MKITTLPGAGTLTDNGVAVTAGQFVSAGRHHGRQAGVHAGRQRQRHRLRQLHLPGAGRRRHGQRRRRSRSVAQHDDASTSPRQRRAGGDQQDGHHAGRHGLHLHGAPTSASAIRTTPRPTTLLAVKITTLPGAGTLTDNGVAVDGRPVRHASADITAGKLVFTPAANANGTGYASFTFQVQDDGGTANGGVDLDPPPNTMTVNVTAVNDAPAGTNNTRHHAGRHGLHVHARRTSASAIPPTLRPTPCWR